MDVLMHSMSVCRWVCVTEAEKVWYLLGDIQITWQHCHLFGPPTLSSHHLLVFQSWVTLTRSILSKSTVLALTFITRVPQRLLLCGTRFPLLHCPFPTWLFFLSFFCFFAAFPLSKSSIWCSCYTAFFFWEVAKFTEIKITIWMMYCANLFKSLQKQRKKSIKIVATTNNFICKEW